MLLLVREMKGAPSTPYWNRVSNPQKASKWITHQRLLEGAWPGLKDKAWFVAFANYCEPKVDKFSKVIFSNISDERFISGFLKNIGVFTESKCPVWLVCVHAIQHHLVNSMLLKEGMFSFLWIKTHVCICVPTHTHAHTLAEGICVNMLSSLAFLQNLLVPFLLLSVCWIANHVLL